MSPAPAFLFSHRFPGRVWNMLAQESGNRIVIEVRDDVTFTTTFSLLDYSTNTFIWKNVVLAEPWWISLAALNTNTVLVNRFMNKGGNPDRKSLIALDAASATVRWEAEEVSFYEWNEAEIFGYRTQNDPVQVKLDLLTGAVREEFWPTASERPITENNKPVFYAEGSDHFGTIKKFVGQTDYVITKGVEYLEFNDWIIISIYVEESAKLANYLLVFDVAGTRVLNLKLGENLAGLGADTFFILSGCLFLVQNKTDLVAYRL